MKLVGAVADAPHRAAGLASRAAAAATYGAATRIESLYADAGFALYAIARPEESSADLIAGGSTEGRERFWFAGDCLLGAQPKASTTSVAGSIDGLLGSLEGSYVGVRLSAGGVVRLYCDSWGLGWIFVRQLRDAVVFASDFRAVCSADDESLSIDVDSQLLELGIGFDPDKQTLFREVSFVPPGGVVDIIGHTSRLVSRSMFEYGEDRGRRSMSEKFAELDNLFDGMAERMAREGRGRVGISLSAGLDSRYALAWVARKGAVGPLLTFGEPESDEVVEAREVAHRNASAPDWHVFSFDRSDFAGWRSMIQSVGNAGIVQWCGWADDWMAFVRSHSPNCIIGYLGDALSGKRLDVLPAGDARAAQLDGSLDLWARRWVAFELDMAGWLDSGLLRPSAQARLPVAACERFGALLESARIAQPHQSALHCNALGRQRRWTGAQPVLLSAYVKPLLFFVDRRYRAFWMQTSLDDMHGQALYHRYAEDRFPKLFPKSPRPTARFVQRVHRRVRRELEQLAGKPLPPKRPPPIVREKLLAPHFADTLQLLDRSAAALDAIVDIARCRAGIEALARGATANGLTDGMLIRLVNLMHLMEIGTPSRRAREP